MFFGNLNFPLGGTAGVSGSTDMASWEGQDYYVPDWNAGSFPKLRSNRVRKIRCVRNACDSAGASGGEVSTGKLLPQRLVTFKSGQYNQQVDGYCRVNASGPTYPTDEFLPSAGVAVNDLFYIVLEGPALVAQSLAVFSNTIGVGDPVVAATGATSGATTAGRFFNADYAAVAANQTGAGLAAQIVNAFGRALSAATTNNTTAALLIDVGFASL